MTSTSGLSLLETIIAIAICGIILAALTSVATNSLRSGRDGNFKVQATQILDTVGRRVAGGADRDLLPAPGASVTVGYGELVTLVDLGDSGWEDAFRANIRHDGPMSIGTSSTIRYRIEVCHRSGGEERCVQGTTLGREGTTT